MPEVNNKINIELDVLTPLAIGAGAEKDWVLGMDYVVDNGYLYKLNLHKIAAAGIDLQKLTSYFAEKNSKGVKELIGQRLEEVSDFRKPMPCNSDNDIKAFVKNQLTGKPIVPGSSIKGAIRSILLEYFTQNDRSQIRNGENRIFGAIKDGTDFMRFIKLSDVEFDKTALVNTKIFNLRNIDGSWAGGWKHGRDNTDGNFGPEPERRERFNTIYESVPPEQHGYGYLMLSENGFNRLPDSQSTALPYTSEKKSVLNSVTHLFEVINLHTQSYLKKELAFFCAYPTDMTSEIKDSIQHLLSEVQIALEDKSCCIFKMSAGSGFHSITGDWQFDDYSINGLDTSGRVSRGLYNHKPSSKSRKIAIFNNGKEFSLMGFVKMSVMDAESIAERERERERQRLERIRINEERKQALEAERKRQEAEAEELRHIAEETIQRRSNYEAAILEADSYFVHSDKSNLDAMKAALSYFEKAAVILPEGDKHLDKIGSLNIIIAGLESSIAQQASADKAKQDAIAAGLTILEDKNLNGQYKVLSFKDISVRVQGWLKKAGADSLPESQDAFLTKTLTRLFGNVIKAKERAEWVDFSSKMWKTLSCWCGEVRARKIYSEVCRKQEF